jgi:hypothetical protein
VGCESVDMIHFTQWWAVLGRVNNPQISYVTGVTQDIRQISACKSCKIFHLACFTICTVPLSYRPEEKK